MQATPAAVFSHGAVLGRELQEAVKGRVTDPARLAAGVTMVVPKLVAVEILEPALQLAEPIQLAVAAGPAGDPELLPFRGWTLSKLQKPRDEAMSMSR